MAADNDFLAAKSWHMLKIWYTGGGPEQGFGYCFADRLPVAQATILWFNYMQFIPPDEPLLSQSQKPYYFHVWPQENNNIIAIAYKRIVCSV